MNWKVGDWVIFELSIGQIKELRDEPYKGSASFSDGSFETSGMLTDRFRPLTLRNKRTVEWFDTYYNYLREINGEAGFNYPDIFRYFANLALEAIDSDPENKKPYEKAEQFLNEAREYKPVIHGTNLFRPNLKKRIS